MNERLRRELRKRYLRLTHEADRIMDNYPCGRALAAHINPRLGEIDRELNGIEAEVASARAKERGAQP